MLCALIPTPDTMLTQMAVSHSPKVPPYRWTLFYGPERHSSYPSVQYCIFNLKKRSWKGGIQVAVEITDDQLAFAQKELNFRSWLMNHLASVPEPERTDYSTKGQDVFTQQLCLLKLHLAIRQGIQQENCRLVSDYLVRDFLDAIGLEQAHIKAQILKELDLNSFSSPQREE